MSEPYSITELSDGRPIELQVSPNDAGLRLDKWLAQQLPEFSRARLQSWIAQGKVLLDGNHTAAKTKLVPGSRVELKLDFSCQQDSAEAQPVEFELLFEDADLLIVNKPAGLTVHPGAGQPDQTLQNGLLYHRPNLAQLPRAGIVHRLDKDTTGVMMVAASTQAHTQLVRALQAREISRDYSALVWGTPVAGATVDAPLGRHPRERTRFAVQQGGRDAVTHYRVVEKFPDHAYLSLKLETGRTHQIRVHMQHMGYPLIGDPMYGRRGDPYRQRLGRQALHATRLKFKHPRSGDEVEFRAPLPTDMQEILDEWRQLD